MEALKSVDLNLPPIVPHNIWRWVKRFDELRGDCTSEEDEAKACAFALTGHYHDQDLDQDARARLDFSDRAIRPDILIHQICDIDSVIGILTDEFPVQDGAVFEYHLINDVSYCLHGSLHIPGWLDPDTRGTTNDLLEYHRIPHAVFGTMDNGRTTIRIFLPRVAREQDDVVFLTKDFLEPFYDLAVKPAANDVLSDHYIRTWPPDYAAEEARAARRTGKPQFSGKSLLGVHLRALLPKILEKVDESQELVFARECFWMVEMKGMKAGTAHPPPRQPTLDANDNLVDPANDPRTLAIDRLFTNWQYGTFRDERWYLDIATTVSFCRADGTPLSALIRKDAHPEILRHFTGESIQRCTSWASRDNGRDYQFDATAQLEGIGGCRLTIRDREKRTVRYFQAYTTDKSLTYHRDGASVALNSSPWRVIERWDEEDKRFFQPIIKMCHKASDEGTTSHSASRFESRVEWGGFPEVHKLISELDVRNWLYFFDTRHLWALKTRQMHARRSILKHIMTHRTDIRWKYMSEVASLIIILVWSANALLNRPAEGGTWNEVRDAGSVHERDRTGTIVPCQPLGTYMLHSLVAHPSYRLSGDRVISMKSILALIFTKKLNPNQADLYLALNPAWPAAQPRPQLIQWGDEPEPGPSTLRPATNNKRRKVTNHLDTKAPDVFGSRPGLIAIPGLDAQEEEAASSEEEDDEERGKGSVTYQELSELLHSVAVQLFAKAPNRAAAEGGGSYCLLKESEKFGVTNDIFKTKQTLKTTWTSYTPYTDSTKWENSVQRLFPTRAEFQSMHRDSTGSPVQWQGLYAMTFWQTWQVVLSRVPPDVEKEVVRAMRKHINDTWHWLPAIEGRKLWNTGRKPSKTQPGTMQNGPWIACNPRFVH